MRRAEVERAARLALLERLRDDMDKSSRDEGSQSGARTCSAAGRARFFAALDSMNRLDVTISASENNATTDMHAN